jgi:predicted DNA-binding protein
MGSSTSSIRIPDGLRKRLERTAKRLKRGKNSIINEALDEYLRRIDREELAVEARRQSLLASEKDHHEETEAWARMADTRGWR